MMFTSDRYGIGHLIFSVIKHYHYFLYGML